MTGNQHDGQSVTQMKDEIESFQLNRLAFPAARAIFCAARASL
jgi:hypothetical protein